MPTIGFDDSGFWKKLQALKSAGSFFVNIHADAATFLQEKIVDEVIAGKWVGYESGNLRRSVEVIPIGKIKSIIASDLTVAPYAVYVLDWSRRTYGRNYLQIALDLWLDEVKRRMKKEYQRAIDHVNARKVYRYKNPFP